MSVRHFLVILVLLSFTLCFAGSWEAIDKGLFVGEFSPPEKYKPGDSKIIVVKIDPQFYSFRLLSASEMKHGNLTAEEWAKKYQLIAAFNAGMFQTDDRTNVGYMKNYKHLNNPRVNSKYFSVAAFNPMDASGSFFKIYDTDQDDIRSIIKKYETVIQNLRLIKRAAQGTWSQQNKKWSEVALGQDKSGNALIIFSRTGYSMHDFAAILKELPIEIDCAQHLEGGPEASLYFSHNKRLIKAVGSYETGFNPNDDNVSFWPLPNVIGLSPR